MYVKNFKYYFVSNQALYASVIHPFFRISINFQFLYILFHFVNLLSHMSYDDFSVKSFSKSTVFTFTNQPHTCTYAYSGDFICTAFPTHVQIYNALNTKLVTKIDVLNNNVKFFTPNTLLYSNKNALYYLSLYDATILRKFTNTAEIKKFSVSDNDLLMTFSENILIYDIKQHAPTNKIRMNNSYGTFLDDKNLVVGNASLIRFYDLRNTKGPLKILNTCNIERIEYNKYAKTLVLHNNLKRTHMFMDKDGNEKSKIVFDQKYCTDISPDGAYYFASSNNIIKVYDIYKKANIHNYRDSENTANGCFALNPVYGQFITCNNNLRFWQPDFDL